MIKFRAWDKGNETYLYNIQDAYDTLSGFVKYDDGVDAEYYDDWIVECPGNIRLIMRNNEFKKTYAELPVIPDYVAEYIEHMKSIHCDIWDAMHYLLRPDNVDEYMEDNPEMFVRAWLDGYTVEE